MHSTQLITGLKKEKDSVLRLTSLWMCCVACVLLKHQEGATKGQLFSCPLVISIGQKAAGGRDALRKQSCDELHGCRDTHTHTDSLLLAYRTLLHKELFIWVTQLDGECTQKLWAFWKPVWNWVAGLHVSHKVSIISPRFPLNTFKVKIFSSSAVHLSQSTVSKTFKTRILDLVR